MLQPNVRRSGVIASEASSMRSAHAPVSCVSFATGSAPRSSVARPQASTSAGRIASDTTPACSQTLRDTRRARSELLGEIHAGVQRRDLVRVAVERLRRTPAEVADAALALLAPARMIDRWIHVRVE